jgi:hypothetical protein
MSDFVKIEDFKNPVQFGDNIHLKVNNNIFIGEVRNRYVHFEGYCNNFIFKHLNLNKYEFCSEHYGYEVGYGDWPEFKSGDFCALTKVLIEIFKLLDPNNKPPKLKRKTIFLRD